MTAVVGVLCRDGVVVGSDSSATFSIDGPHSTIEQPTEKIYVIDDRVVVAGTGSVGLGQRFCRVVKGLVAEKGKERMLCNPEPIQIAKAFSKFAQMDFAETGAKLGQYGCLVAFPSSDKPHLCELALADYQPQLFDDRIWYGSLGSTQTISDAFLGFIRGIFWKDGPPTVAGGIFATLWTLQHAIDVNPGGVNAPARIAALAPDRDGKLMARILAEAELEQYRQSIDEAKAYLGRYAMKLEAPQQAHELPSAHQ